MREEWLVQVLREIEEFAKARNLVTMFPLIEAGYAAAKQELKLPAPIQLISSCSRKHRSMEIEVEIAELPLQTTTANQVGT